MLCWRCLVVNWVVGVDSGHKRETLRYIRSLPFSSIPEEGEGTSAAPHASIHRDAFGPMRTTPVVCRLQFSTMTTASETPEEKPIFKEHRKRVVTLVEADLKPQEDYKKNAIIGSVMGDTPNLRNMELFITNVWRFSKSHRFLLTVRKRDFEFNPDYITTVPLRVSLTSLPIGYWSNKALGHGGPYSQFETPCSGKANETDDTLSL
ncbi:hypothetical protein RDI58_027174 [Solanum bulbocastanum]|uniref:Uncharacterized protein n=1 Tax=Solanum bulbocastanum TaxID=147425 RepID=A0AAN8Y428_SOLBU